MSRYDDLVKEALSKQKTKKKRKYNNVPTEDGYDSGKEARRAFELKLLLRAGEISNLMEQVTFNLLPKQVGEQKVDYVADFVYTDMNGERVVEDAKGVRTPDYIIKRKLMLYVHGIRIKET